MFLLRLLYICLSVLVACPVVGYAAEKREICLVPPQGMKVLESDTGVVCHKGDLLVIDATYQGDLPAIDGYLLAVRIAQYCDLKRPVISITSNVAVCYYIGYMRLWK